MTRPEPAAVAVGSVRRLNGLPSYTDPTAAARRSPVGGARVAAADDLRGEALHLFELRAALEQEQLDARVLELFDARRDLLGRPHEAGAQAAVRDRVVFERHALLQLRAREPLLVVVVARGRLPHVRDARELLLRLALRVADDGV